MGLEATVLCLDNSEWMRNGDYSPSRLEAQVDAMNLVCNAKVNQNPESCVGVLSMASSVKVLVTPTREPARLFTCAQKLQPDGESDFIGGLMVAQLALKHRMNKNQRQRIVLFVGSPVNVEQAKLVKLGKKLKKNNVAVDVVNFGEEAVNTEKLEAFVDACNSNDNSHLVTVPPGPHLLSDILISSPVIAEEGSVPVASAGGAGAGAGAGGFDFDPNEDPELALALRMSMEEERARQAAEQDKGGDGAKPEAAGETPAVANVAQSAEAEDDEQALMAQAIAMSMGQDPSAAAATGAAGGGDAFDAELAMAMQMSMQDAGVAPMDVEPAAKEGQKKDDAPAASNAPAAALQDPDFVGSVLGSLPGVDMSDERIKNLLQNVQGEEKKDDDKKDEKK